MEKSLQVPSSNELVPTQWEVLKEQSAMLVKSGFLPPALNTPEKVIAVALKGKELGVPMMEALSKIDIIQGKPAVAPQLMLALALRTGQVEWHHIETTDQKAVFKIKRKNMPEPFSAEFGVKEATQQNLMGKDNYKKQPRTMFEWRAIAKCLRFAFPDAISGLYTPEELGADLTDEGEVIAPKRAVSMPSERTILPIETPKVEEVKEDVEPDEDNTDPVDEIPFPGDAREGADVPSDALFKHFKATLREKGLTDRVKQWCVTAYDKSSSKDLTATQINAILDLIKSGAIRAD